jgi:predicted GNAT family N-acyltransferase
LDIEYHSLDSLSSPLKFDCGVPPLNEYFHKRALREHQTDIGKTTVATTTEEKPAVVGFYTICNSEMVRSRLPESQTKGLPKYSAFPAILLARLAVDNSFRDRKYGRRLLMHALHKTFDLSKETAIRMIVVDAKDDKAASFYTKHDFIPLEDDPHKLFLPMKMIREGFKQVNL